MHALHPSRSTWQRVGITAAIAIGMVALVTRGSAQEVRTVPPPAVDLAPSGAEDSIVLAGGCFWGVQGVFQHTAGVTSAVSGYAGGDASTARYEAVGSGTTGHAEVVRVTYDPRRISYGRILQIYFSVAHDPTQLNRQGPDRGTQYRSAIFPARSEQAQVAESYIAQLNGAQVYDAAIVTAIEPDRAFYPAEDYHQDYLTRHPSQPYIAITDLPKVEALNRLFPESYREEPALVASSSAGQ